MGPVRRRVAAYGLAALLVGGLVWAGFVYEAEPDPKTLLSSVDIQIRLASGMPERDSHGRELESRARMLRDARADLDRLEAALPDFAPAREYRAFLCYLDGDYRMAAEHYRQLRGMGECSEELWDSAVLNEVRMLRMAGDLDRALQLLEETRGRLQAGNLGSADLHAARMLAALDRLEEAVEAADRVGRRGAEDPMAAIEAGRLLEEWRQAGRAEAAYLAAGAGNATGTYYRARLKIRAGDVDEGLRLLELAVSAAPSDVRRLVARDLRDWEAVAGNGRFRDLIGPEGNVSAPGR